MRCSMLRRPSAGACRGSEKVKLPEPGLAARAGRAGGSPAPRKRAPALTAGQPPASGSSLCAALFAGSGVSRLAVSGRRGDRALRHDPAPIRRPSRYGRFRPCTASSGSARHGSGTFTPARCPPDEPCFTVDQIPSSDAHMGWIHALFRPRRQPVPGLPCRSRRRQTGSSSRISRPCRRRTQSSAEDPERYRIHASNFWLSVARKPQASAVQPPGRPFG